MNFIFKRYQKEGKGVSNNSLMCEILSFKYIKMYVTPFAHYDVYWHEKE